MVGADGDRAVEREVLESGLVLNLIGAAVLAGAYGRLARELPEAERGLEKMRVKWHERGRALCEELCAALADGPAPTQ